MPPKKTGTPTRQGTVPPAGEILRNAATWKRSHPVLRPAGFSDDGRNKSCAVRPFARLEFANYQFDYSTGLLTSQYSPLTMWRIISCFPFGACGKRVLPVTGKANDAIGRKYGVGTRKRVNELRIRGYCFLSAK